MPDSRREHERYDTTIPVRFERKKDFLIEYTKNISLGGVFVRMRTPLILGSTVRLALLPPQTDDPIHVVGKIVFVVDPETATREGKEPGIGVRFTEVTDEAQERLSECVERLSKVYRGRVLLVDGDAGHRDLASETLNKLDFNVVTLSSAAQALEVLWREPFDAIIAAVSLPGMNGLELRENLQRDPDGRNIPFVLLLGDKDKDDAARATRLELAGTLRKPLDAGACAALLETLIK